MVEHTYIYNGRFDFEAGGSIEDLHITYHSSEKEYRPDAPGAAKTAPRKVILICHALTANSDAQDWWPKLVGPGLLFDTDKYFVFCVNMLTSCYGSSGPSSTNPKTGRPYYFDFPKTTVRDIARAIILVRQHLGIESVDLLVGASIGGFQALELAIMEPQVYKKAIFMATCSRITPWISAFEESQRMALEADPTFRQCESLDGGKAALRCARTIALISYRCDDGYNIKQEEKDENVMFADNAASYHRYQGDKFVKRFDAYSYYYLSYAVDSTNVGRNRGGVTKALSTITAESTVIAIDSDLIFPPKDMIKIAQAIPGAKFETITSHYGHDGFLIESEQIERLSRPIVDSI